MKKINQLTVADFPGLELSEDQFNTWKAAKVQVEKSVMIFALITLTILVIALLTSGMLVAPGAFLIILIMFGIRSKSNRMTKEMGLNDKKILAARKGKFKA